MEMFAAMLVATVLAQDPPAPAPEQPEGLYISLSGLGVVQQDSELRAVGGIGLDAVFEFDAGFGGRIGVGNTWTFDFPVSLSVEGEYTYRTSNIKQLVAPGLTVPAWGQNVTHSIMVNAIGDWDIVNGFGFYLGGGAGGAITSTDLTVDLGGPVLAFPNDSDFSLAWQVMGGARWSIGEHWVLFGGVRYFDAGDVDFETFGGTNRSLNVELGVRFYF